MPFLFARTLLSRILSSINGQIDEEELMPELPEVETIRQALRRLILGRRISRVTVRGKRVLRGTSGKELRGRLLRRRMTECLRRGKYLIAQGEDFSLLIHLGMSGRLSFYPEGNPPQRHTHLILGFADGSELHYDDPRAFGRIRLYPLLPLTQIPEVARLGWDPLEGRLPLARLEEGIRRRKAAIKQVLMNQRLFAGIGNIYASEILFRSSIDPSRPACDLTRPELKKLQRATREVLRRAIQEGGTSIISFADAEGRKGAYQHLLQVYGRAEEACPRCQTRILNRPIVGRSTYFCPHCQR